MLDTCRYITKVMPLVKEGLLCIPKTITNLEFEPLLNSLTKDKYPLGSLFGLVLNECPLLSRQNVLDLLRRLFGERKDISLLNLENFDVDPRILGFITRLLNSNASVLTSLILKGIVLIEIKNSLKSLFNSLKSNITLCTLSLQEFKLGNSSDRVIFEDLIVSLLENTTISILDLEDNMLDDFSCVELAKLLSKNVYLESLFLGYNLIQDNGVKILSESLMDNHSLKALDLTANRITEKGIEDIAKVLRSNKHLSSLYLDGNKFGDVGTRILTHALYDEHNGTLTNLHIVGNRMTDEGASRLANLIKNNSTLSTLSIGGKITVSNDGMRRISDNLKQYNKSLTEISVLMLMKDRIRREIEASLLRNRQWNLVWKKETLLQYIKKKRDSRFDKQCIQMIFRYVFPVEEIHSYSDISAIPLTPLHLISQSTPTRKRSEHFEKEKNFAFRTVLREEYNTGESEISFPLPHQ